MALGLAAIGGQVIGGALVQGDVAALGWRAYLLINVPIGIAALAAAPRAIPESRAADAGRLDLGGAALLAAALVAILILRWRARVTAGRSGRGSRSSSPT
jgi:MFS family permease